MLEPSKAEIPSRKSQAPRALDCEVDRIRGAYSRREYMVPKDRYSLFKEGNLLSNLELQREIIRTLRRFKHTQLERETVLDVGCGKGFWLRQLVQWGARPENLFGVDLLEEKINEGKALCPKGITLRCADASKLEFKGATFDLILQFTVFTSILDPAMRKNLASEMCRVLKPGGAILWLDFFFNNPKNPDVRGIGRKEIRTLFPNCVAALRRVLLAPPLVRLLAPRSLLLCQFLAALRIFNTHYLGLILKEKRESPL